MALPSADPAFKSPNSPPETLELNRVFQDISLSVYTRIRRCQPHETRRIKSGNECSQLMHLFLQLDDSLCQSLTFVGKKLMDVTRLHAPLLELGIGLGEVLQKAR